IAHHKSYHLYRRDEAEAHQNEAKEEGRTLLAMPRVDLLHERRAGVKGSNTASKSKRRKEDDDLARLPATDGHINFCEDLEHVRLHSTIATAIRTAKKTKPVETERGVPLAPSAKDLRPWYTESRKAKPDEEEADAKRKRNAPKKSVRDPLTSITHQLPARHASTAISTAYKSKHTYPLRQPPNANALTNTNTNTAQLPEVQARPTRESPERARAMELIRRKQPEMRRSEMASSVHGGGYGDVFNRREVEEAHRGRKRRDPRRW
ncbi:hypothetical protein K438DRAFT_1620710, partial [Mycena galopus ATCC 62051]